MTKILNLTQHLGTDEQKKSGVIDIQNPKLKELLTFNDIPTALDIEQRAVEITSIAKEAGATAAMIGGAPYLMGTLEQTLKKAGIQPLYSFTERVSVENTNPDGTITKTAIFKHKGWVQV